MAKRKCCKKFEDAVYSEKQYLETGNKTVERPYKYCPKCGHKYPKR